ncbi:hypothetical protein HDU87_001834 [Geranomyces variabilis]|uniref:GYF domain-containing protein n=1 Tax=Geranomyces variabilis TaxID=109894 RepID=A0AAD5XNQ8_9FUNG|nr:hypothetical protein HDU87_001834 [Geranomyces variabilis]
MAMNFGPQWMRKIPSNEDNGRVSPTLTPTTPTGATQNITWGLGAGSKSATAGSSGGDHVAQSSRDHPTWSSSSAQGSLQFKFSREFILSLFDPSIPTPPDFKPAAAMTSERVLEPMANIPLNENERKLFTSQSVNSEISARRTPHGRGETKDGVVRPAPRGPGTAQRGYSNRTDRVGSQSDGYRPTRRADAVGDEDPWDMPAGVGSFSSNGMFARDTPDTGRDETLLFANRGRDSPLRTGSPASIERRDISPGKTAKPPHSGPINGTATHLNTAQPSRTNEDANRNSYVDMFSTFGSSSSLSTPMGGAGSTGLGARLGASDPLAAPSMTRSLSNHSLTRTSNQPPPGIVPAPTPFVPQMWQYKDPSGVVQGPFTSAQMHEWFRAGYFSDELPIKRADEYSYEPLVRLLQKHGRDRPFLANMDEAERLFRQLESQRRVPVATPGGSTAYNAFGTFGAGASAQSMYAPGGATGFGAGGLESLSTGAYSRTSSWGAESPGAIRTGWSALNPEVERRGSPLGVAVPGSPAAGMQSAYFDQRATQAEDGFTVGGSSSQRPAPAAFRSFSAAQSSSAPQSPAANLFSGPILDFAAAQRDKQPAWGNISGLAGSHYHDDASPLDVVSKLIDESHYEHQIGEQFSRLSVDPASETLPNQAPVANQAPSPVKQESDKPVSKARKTRKEERQERFERENELRKQQQKKGVAAKAATAAAPTAVSETETSAPAPAVDLRQIMSEEHTRSKREKEQAALENERRIQAEIEDAEKASSSAVAATSAWGASGEVNGTAEQKASKPTLKQIQEAERARAAIEENVRAQRAQKAILQQAQMIQEQEALVASQSLIKDQGGGAVWGGAAAAAPKSQPSAARQKKTLADIMEKEARRKRKEAELAESALAGQPTGTGKRYADTIATSGTSNSAIAHAAGAKPPVVNRPATVVASGSVVKAKGPAAVATSGTASRPDENVVGPWNVVGKQGQVVRPPAPPSVRPAALPTAPAAPRIVSVHVNPSPPVVATNELKAKGPTSAFMQWCRTVLQPLSRNNGVNVEDFIGILLSINPNESAITQSICDDILGGLTAIDPRKFAEEFGRRRKADAQGTVVSGAGDVGWTSVGASATASGAGDTGAAKGNRGGSDNSLQSFDSGNKFVVVGKQTKKKKGKR